MNVKKENWFWCELCECISYDYECECGATWCNAGGCKKCKDLHPIIEKMVKEKNTPSKEECLKNKKDLDMSEQEVLKKIFNE